MDKGRRKFDLKNYRQKYRKSSKSSLCEAFATVQILHPILRSHHPYPLQRQLGLQVFVQTVIVGKQLLQQFLLGRQPHLEEAGGQLLLDVALESAPRDKQAFVRAAVGTFPAAVSGLALCLEDRFHQPRQTTALEARGNELCNLIVGQVFQVGIFCRIV